MAAYGGLETEVAPTIMRYTHADVEVPLTADDAADELPPPAARRARTPLLVAACGLAAAAAAAVLCWPATSQALRTRAPMENDLQEKAEEPQWRSVATAAGEVRNWNWPWSEDPKKFKVIKKLDLTVQSSSAGELTFKCLRYQFNESVKCDDKGVIMLHGFGARKEEFRPLLERWESFNVTQCALACDLRGYSPGASPRALKEYAYDAMVKDIYQFADKMGYKKFHLLGTDHGAALTWHFAGQEPEDPKVRRLKGIVAVGVPHLALLSELLSGQVPDKALNLPSHKAHEPQQVADFYFNYFAAANITKEPRLLPIANALGVAFGNRGALKKALWWYAANFPKYIALPPVLPDETFKQEKYLKDARFHGSLVMREGLKGIFHQSALNNPRRAVPAQKLLGKISGPVMHVCLENDSNFPCFDTGDQNIDFLKDEKLYELRVLKCGLSALANPLGCVTPKERLDFLDYISSGVDAW